MNVLASTRVKILRLMTLFINFIQNGKNSLSLDLNDITQGDMNLSNDLKRDINIEV